MKMVPKLNFLFCILYGTIWQNHFINISLSYFLNNLNTQVVKCVCVGCVGVSTCTCVSQWFILHSNFCLFVPD